MAESSEYFSGERVTPNMASFKEIVRIWTGETGLPPQSVIQLWKDHKARYVFAEKFCSGKKVLDIACGTAYGKNLLTNTKLYVGIDISHQTLKNVKNLEKNEYLVTADARNTPLAANSFDTVISFETLEHIPLENINRFLENICQVLKEDGTLIISTPNRNLSNPATTINDQPKNTFHRFEMNSREFMDFLKPYFHNTEFFGQAVKKYPPERIVLLRKFKTLGKMISGELSKISSVKDIDNNHQPSYLMAICSSPIKKNLETSPVTFEEIVIPEHTSYPA